MIWTLFQVFFKMGVVIFKDLLLEKNWSSTFIKLIVLYPWVPRWVEISEWFWRRCNTDDDNANDDILDLTNSYFELKIDNISLFLCSFTGQRSSSDSTVCNLCRLPNVVTNSSSAYIYTQTNIKLNASRAVDGEYQSHANGDCAGTKVSKTFARAWWNVILPGLATIYKVNLLFRENSKFFEW